jgi:hypothetical protein
MPQRRKKSSHSVTLGGSFLTRARIIFLLSFLSVISLLTLSFYNSSKNGAIEKNIITPLRSAAKSFIDSLSETSSDYSENNTNVQYNSEFQYSVDNTTPTPIPEVENSYYESYYNSNNYYQASYTPSKSFEQIVQENNAWFEEQKAANEKWFQEQSSKNAAESRAKYDAAVQQMDSEYEANVQKARDEQEAWKKEHGF